jgi:hypothetical protein
MLIDYCLGLKGFGWSSVGCLEGMQLEDYLDTLMDDDTTVALMKQDPDYSKGDENLARRELFYVERLTFDRVMVPLGYKAISVTGNHQQIIDYILTKKMPIILRGDFSSISRITGHMNMCIGYELVNGAVNRVQNLDPYGDANKGYLYWRDNNPRGLTDGDGVMYPITFFLQKGSISGLSAVPV